jgi:hypothetical protein
VIGLLDPRPLSAFACLLGWWISRQMSVCLTVGILVYALGMFAL